LRRDWVHWHNEKLWGVAGPRKPAPSLEGAEVGRCGQRVLLTFYEVTCDRPPTITAWFPGDRNKRSHHVHDRRDIMTATGEDS